MLLLLLICVSVSVVIVAVVGAVDLTALWFMLLVVVAVVVVAARRTHILVFNQTKATSTDTERAESRVKCFVA